ncbi:MAG: monovalent cation/H+ antiporter complex subunit F [Lachnospiraceae bacterium]|nr:monovalent cation/H+ antiporter complex subunit F [Lachnospiraceae bacterium]
MNSGIASLEAAYQIVFIGAIIILALMMILCLIRAIIGPRVADRIVTVNMMGTMVMVTIAIFALMRNESYLVDICIIYAMISFLAVIVISKVYMGVFNEKNQEKEKRAE